VEEQMATNFQGWHKPQDSGPGLRRKYRCGARFQLETCGLDRAGSFFTERTETSEVSDSRCKFRLKTEIATEVILAVRALAGHDGGADLLRPVLFRAVHVERNGKGWNVTAAKLQRDDPWTGGVLKAEE
jgi:hypothetical protein